MKRDAVTHVEFLEEVMKVSNDIASISANLTKTLDEKPSFTFWTTLAKAFETQTKQAAQSQLTHSSAWVS